MIPVTLAGRLTIPMVLDTSAPISTLSWPTGNNLLEEGMVEPIGVNGTRYLMQGLSVEQQPLPGLIVRFARGATVAGALGTLGLNFLIQFRYIHYDVDALLLTLTRAS